MVDVVVSIPDASLDLIRGPNAPARVGGTITDPVAAAALVRSVDPYEAFGCGPLYDAQRGVFGTVHRLYRSPQGDIALTNDHVHRAFREGVIEARHGRHYTWDEAVIDISLFSDLPREAINRALDRASAAASRLTIGSRVMFCGNAAGQIEGAPQIVDGEIWLQDGGDFFARTPWSILGGSSGSAVKTYPDGWEDFSARGRFLAAMDPASEMVGVLHSSANHKQNNGVLQGAGVFQPITADIRV